MATASARRGPSAGISLAAGAGQGERRGGVLGQPGGQPLAVRGDFGAGVAGTDHHEGAARCSLGGVGGHRGQFELADDVVAQVGGFGGAAEPVRVVGDARDGQQLVHAARGQDEPVVAELADGALRACPAHHLLPGIDVVDRAEHEPGRA
jgi:hypothetical protein